MQDKQNPYIDIKYAVSKKEVEKEHQELTKQFGTDVYVYTLSVEPNIRLPDLVFVANGGLSLPRLPEPCILLPYMKYIQRKRELPYLKRMYSDLGIKTIAFPGSSSAPFEGQAELKWFHGGTLAVGGYGHRSTKKSFDILDTLLNRIYTKHGLVPPKLLILPLESDTYYHLDVAMLEFGRSGRSGRSGQSVNQCIVHKRAFSEESIAKLRKFLGHTAVHVLDTKDSFCLNSVVDGKNLITHKITDAKAKHALETITGLHIKQVNTEEFERSGGSVRCMTLDIYT